MHRRHRVLCSRTHGKGSDCPVCTANAQKRVQLEHCLQCCCGERKTSHGQDPP